MIPPTEQILIERIVDPRLRLLFTHWMELRAGRAMPRRCEIDPVAIPRVLSIIFLCDYERGGCRLRYRVVGEDIRSAHDRDMQGRYQDELFDGAERERHLARTRRVMEAPSIIYAAGEVYGFAGRRGTGERIALPLSDDGVVADALIGATAYSWSDPVAYTGGPSQRMRFEYWNLDGTTEIGPGESGVGAADSASAGIE